MTKPCLICQHLKLREYPKHAAEGLGRCSKASGAYFVQIGRVRDCGKFSELREDKAEARRVWWLQKRDSKK